jgi:nitrate reductase NapE component
MDHAMTPSWRKPVGTLAILLFIILWCVLVVTLAGGVGRWHWSLQAVFYLVAGIAWITPLKPALLWMETGRWR